MPIGVTEKSYGRVSEDQQKSMSGLEFVQGLVDGFLPLNTMARTLGYDITEVESGRVVITAVPNDTHLNPAGGVHGGLSATLLDSCMGLAVLSKLEKGIGQTTLEFKISLVRPITPETGLIRAEGIVLTCGRRVGTAEGRVTDSNGRLLAHGTITCLIFYLLPGPHPVLHAEPKRKLLGWDAHREISAKAQPYVSAGANAAITTSHDQ
jgi:uncharacterized protein (TIGR00369 family)